MKVMADMIPSEDDWIWYRKTSNAMAAQAVILGGNVRVGLEDNLYLKGVLASNGQLVEKAARIVDDLGAKILNPKEVREKLKLKKHF